MAKNNNQDRQPADIKSLGGICKSIERNKLSYVLSKIDNDEINSTNAELNQTLSDILYLKNELTK